MQTKTDGGRGSSLRDSANKDRWREGQFFEGAVQTKTQMEGGATKMQMEGGAVL